MTSQRIECYQGGVHRGHCHIQFIKINYDVPTYSIVEKCLGLIVIDSFSHEIMHSGKIGMLLPREE